MTFMHSNPRPGRLLLSAAATLTATSLAPAQVTFSIDYHSSTVSVVDGFLATPITDGDLLTPAAGAPILGPLASPGILATGGTLGIGTYAGCVGHPPFAACGIEVDAVSFGAEPPAQNALGQERWYFSVDEDAVGIPAFGAFPNVTSEGVAGPALEASADVFADLGMLPGPLPPFAAPIGNTAVLDGNGMISATGVKYPGLGLLEPNLSGVPPHPGDNLDALDLEGPIAAAGLTYFSLDASFIDPKTGLPNSRTALTNGFVGGDVLASPPGGPPFVYAPAAALGLDLLGPDTDDLDALVLWENGLAGFQSPVQPYSWAAGTDMLFFSVRRGSAVIGMIDSLLGVPIEEGDILMPPIPGGPTPFPAIWIAAENLGLDAVRSGAVCADELNALDLKSISAPVRDCNGNLVEDAVEIATGGVPDCNRNGVPDACDIASGRSCDSDGNGIPDECDWGVPTTYCAGKVSSFGPGCVPLIDSTGSPSVTCPSPFRIDAANANNFVSGLLFYGTSGPAALPFLGGTLCVMPPLTRTPIQLSAGSPPFGNCTGTFTFDMNARIQSGIDPALGAGVTVHSQYWFRDTPNTFGVGLTNGLTFTICP